MTLLHSQWHAGAGIQNSLCFLEAAPDRVCTMGCTVQKENRRIASSNLRALASGSGYGGRGRTGHRPFVPGPMQAEGGTVRRSARLPKPKARSGQVYYSAKVQDHESHKAAWATTSKVSTGLESSYSRIDRCGTTQPSKFRTMPRHQ